MKHTNFFAALLVASSFFIGCDKDDNDDYYNEQPPAVQANVVKGSGDIAPFLSQFRSLLGDPVNTTPGQTSGRREVNWDGVPANALNPFPLSFFNDTSAAGPNGRKRGLVYVNTGVTIRLDTTDFAEIDPSYAAQFDAFSSKKILTSIGSPVSEVVFKVPGTNTDAFIKGFGVVFTDVDDAASTSLEFYNGNKSLGVFKAPARAAGSSFSFLGVHFPNEKITRVKITNGNGVLAAGVKDVSDGGQKDLVAMDDFFYSEPVSIQ